MCDPTCSRAARRSGSETSGRVGRVMANAPYARRRESVEGTQPQVIPIKGSGGRSRPKPGVHSRTPDFGVKYRGFVPCRPRPALFVLTYRRISESTNLRIYEFTNLR